MSRRKPAGGGATCRRLAEAISSLQEIHDALRAGDGPPAAEPREESSGDSRAMEKMREKIARLELSNSDLAARLEAVPGQPGQGPQEDLLANLYVAGYHLQRAQDLQAVLNSVKEILLNLVGAEAFALYLLDADGRTMTQVADEHSRPPAGSRVPLREGIMGVVVKTGIAYFDGERQLGDFHNPVACVPLKAEGQLLGVIQIHRLFTQKKTLTSQDHEIFTLLAETAGTALLSALLRQRYLRRGQDHPIPWGDLLQCVEQTSDQGGRPAWNSPPGKTDGKGDHA